MIHDCHAEVMAFRAFNRWVLNELEIMLLEPSYQSRYLEVRSPQEHTVSDDLRPGYVFKKNISFHFFTTEAPCGDASMQLLIRSKPPEDVVPWSVVSPHSSEDAAPLLLGRGYFSQLGAVRRKPARGDAESTMSKSCTDKLALKQFTGILSFPADSIIAQTPSCFIQSFVVYQDQYDCAAYGRAFGSKGRLEAIASEGRLFDVSTLPCSFPRFEFAKQSLEPPSRASNISALWIRRSGSSSNDTIEVLLNGVKQGFKQLEERQGKESAVCRKQMWSVGVRIQGLLARTHERHSASSRLDGPPAPSYRAAKEEVARSWKMELKRRVVCTLTGWIPNTGDEEWSLS